MNKQVKNQEKAQIQFISNVDEAKNLLSELQSYFDDHMEVSSDDVHWGHVGTAEYYLQHIKEISDRVFKRGEYAI